MKQLFFVLSTFLFFGTLRSQTVTLDDFKSLSGAWKGQLTYLDYTSNTKESIGATCTAMIKGNNAFELDFRYPGENNKGGSDLYMIEENGSRVKGMKVIERVKNADGSVKIVLEEKGPDGNENRMATFHFMLEIAKNDFVVTKMVKFDGENNYFQRNQYVFNR